MSDQSQNKPDPDNYFAHAGTPRRVNHDQMPSDHLGVLIASGILLAIGGWGLYIVVMETIPRVGQRWLFFLLLQLAITGLTIPLVRYWNVRFTPVNRELPPGIVIVRQSVWVALFMVTCAWLQIPRMLTWSMAFFLGIVFIVIEFFLRMRERQFEQLDEEILE